MKIAFVSRETSGTQIVATLDPERDPVWRGDPDILTMIEKSLKSEGLEEPWSDSKLEKITQVISGSYFWAAEVTDADQVQEP